MSYGRRGAEDWEFEYDPLSEFEAPGELDDPAPDADPPPGAEDGTADPGGAPAALKQKIHDVGKTWSRSDRELSDGSVSDGDGSDWRVNQ
ncbi:hypothetical protein ACWDKQ_13320 [Saccharopolyspora sp. NPDC000995]